MRKKKRAPKGSVTWWKKKCDHLFRKMVRARGICARCGVRAPNKTMHCSHVKSVGAYPSLQLDIKNVLCLCHKDHIYWWHKEPTEAGKWFENKFPEEAAYLEVAKNNTIKKSIGDYEKLYEELEERLENKNYF